MDSWMFKDLLVFDIIQILMSSHHSILIFFPNKELNKMKIVIWVSWWGCLEASPIALSACVVSKTFETKQWTCMWRNILSESSFSFMHCWLILKDVKEWVMVTQEPPGPAMKKMWRRKGWSVEWRANLCVRKGRRGVFQELWLPKRSIDCRR